MFVVSKEIEMELQKKYPNAFISDIIHNLFYLLLQKTFKDGSANVRDFGSFVCFQTHSNKLCQDKIRLKFKPSYTLIKRIATDPYLLNIVKVKSQVPFNNEGKCDQKLKSINRKTFDEAIKSGKKNTIENVTNETIIDILNS